MIKEHETMSYKKLVCYCGLLVAFILMASGHAFAQQNLNVAVLVNSANSTGYNTSASSPGEFQMYAKQYLDSLQVPYDIIDTATTAPPSNLSSRQLILAGHRALNLSAAWQQAILTAVQSGTGFVNLDFDLSIGTQAHIQTIFGATGAVSGTPASTITVPAAVLTDGVSPHFIAAFQRRFLNDPVGDIAYNFHPDANNVLQTVTATDLTNATGTVIAQLGTDPLILAKTSGSGRAVNFGTYLYLMADRFGFVQGVDDLFWRSMVWAARKPFVIRGYPRLWAVQMDDTKGGWPSRNADLYNPSYTGNVTPLGVGGPWKVTGYLFITSQEPGTDDRAAMLNDIRAGKLQVAPHAFGNTDLGDMYWNATSGALTDSQWLDNIDAIQTWQVGLGGSDSIPSFSKSLVCHFWDLSNNTGWDLWNTFGFRYITSIQLPGFQNPNGGPDSGLERIHAKPFWQYQLPPKFTRDENYPFFFADKYTINSRAGLPPVTFPLFSTQYIDDNAYPRPDFIWPSTTYNMSAAQSADQLERYTWRHFSGLQPIQIYTHDSNNMELSTASDRQATIQQSSQWLTQNGARMTFMQDLGAYIYARNNSLLTQATAVGNQISYTFTGASADPDGNPIATQVYVFLNDTSQVTESVNGFSKGTSVTVPSPPTVQSISPTFGPIAGGTQVTITGTGFSSTSTVYFGAATATSVTFVNSSSLKATTPAAAVGTVDVTVTTSNGSVLLPGAFTYLGPPQTTRVSPTSGPNTGGNVLNIYGSSFTSDDTVTVAGNPATNVHLISTSLLSATIPAGTIGTKGNVTVTSSLGTSTLSQSYTYLDSRSILMQDSFNGDSTAVWAPSPLGLAQGWTRANGAFAYSGIGHTQQFAGNGSWTDYDVEAKILLFTASNWPGGLRGRVNPTTGASYAVWLYPGSSQVILYRTTGWNIDSPGLVTLASAPLTFDTTNFHTLKLSFRGSSISVLWDGTQAINVSDSTNPSGLIALDVSNQPVEFEDVLVTQPVLTGVSVSPTSFTRTAIGLTQQLTLTASYLDGSKKNVTADATTTYATSNTSVATVSSTGLVTTTGNGTATITAVYGGFAASVAVTVNTALPPSPLGITVTPSSFVLAFAGAAQPLTVTAAYDNGTFQNVTTAGATYGSSNSGVATVSSAGVVTAVKNGTAQITVTFGSLSAQVTATVNFTTAPPTISRISPTEGTSTGGDSMDVYGSNLTGGTAVTVGGASASLLSVAPDGSRMTVATPAGTAGSAATVALSNVNGTASLTNGFSYVAAGSILFADSFNQANLNNWTASPLGLFTNWSAAQDIADYNGGGATQIYAGSGSWTDYTVEAKFQLFSTNNYPGGLRGRVNLSTGQCYVAWLYPASNTVRLFLSQGWSIDTPGLDQLGQATVANMNPNQFHDMKLVFSGSAISVVFDGSTIIQATDSTLAAGAIALDVSNQHIQFEDVLVTGTIKSPAPTISRISPTEGTSNGGDSMDVYGSNLTSGTAVTIGGASATFVSVTPDGSLMKVLTPAGNAGAATVTLTNTGGTASLTSGFSYVAAGSILFADSFNEANLNNWTASPLGMFSNWSAAQDVADYNGGGHTQIYAGSGSWTDYTVETKFQLFSSNNYPGGLRGRVNLSTGQCYVAWLYPGSNTVRLFLSQGWSIDTPGLTQLGQATVANMNPSQFHDMKLVFSGSSISVVFDGPTIIQATDTTLASGAIALDVSNQHIQYEDVFVTQP